MVWRCSALIIAPPYKTSHYAALLREVCPELDDCGPGRLRAARLPELRTVIAFGDQRVPGAYHWDDVLVMAEDRAVQANRLRLLLAVRDAVGALGDLSQIPR